MVSSYDQKQETNVCYLSPKYTNSVVICHNLFHRDLDQFSLSQDIPLVYNIDDIMLFELSDWELATALELLARLSHARYWEINLRKT